MHHFKMIGLHVKFSWERHIYYSTACVGKETAFAIPCPFIRSHTSNWAASPLADQFTTDHLI